MSDHQDNDIDNQKAVSAKSYDFENSYDLTGSEVPMDDFAVLHDDKAVIDCTTIPSLSLNDIHCDVADFEIEDVEDLQENLKSYDDAAYWLTALINLSPTGALLLKNAVNYDWQVAFEDLDNDGWSLQTDQFITIINKAQIKPESLARSPFFMNTIVCDFIRSLRDIWLEEKSEIDYSEYCPETVLKIERMRAADIESITLQVAWELRSAGYSVLWRHILGSDIGDMAMLLSRFLEHDPASLFDGSALLVAFKQWYADEERINNVDRVALEICDDILFAAQDSKAFANKILAKEEIGAFFALPEGRIYLSSMINEIMKNPYFSALHDSINEAHLYHIIRDLEVCYVGNVPFRDPALADKIFPDYTKVLK